MGAGPAGFATARSYRRYGGDGAVTLVGVEPRLPYERPPLTKSFLRGEVDARELILEPEAWFDEHEVELRLGVRANRIDPQRGTVTLSDRVDYPGGRFTIWYSRAGTAVGVLTHERDQDYERGRELIARGEPSP